MFICKLLFEAIIHFLGGSWRRVVFIIVFSNLFRSFLMFFQQHLDDKHLSRFLEADGVMDLHDQAELKSKTNVS